MHEAELMSQQRPIGEARALSSVAHTKSSLLRLSCLLFHIDNNKQHIRSTLVSLFHFLHRRAPVLTYWVVEHHEREAVLEFESWLCYY